MRIQFDDDPQDGRTELAFHHNFVLFCFGLVLVGSACLLMCLEQMEPMIF
jgi:hypothetical protein